MNDDATAVHAARAGTYTSIAGQELPFVAGGPFRW